MADTGPRRPTLLDLGTPAVAPAPERSRGRKLSASSIVRRYFTDTETGRPLVSTRWVRNNMPYKLRMSYSRVAWYEQDVKDVLDAAERLGLRVHEVRLPGREQ